MSEEKAHNTEILKDTRWAGLLKEVRQWPLDAPEWDLVQAFADQIQLVVGEKLQEREAGRLQLQQALDQLWNNHEEALECFDLDLSNWQATDCPIEQVAERTGKVKDLLAQLAQCQALDDQSPRTFPERRKRSADLNAVHERINSLMEQLNQDFFASAPEPAPTLDEDAEEDDHPPEPPGPGKDPSDKRPDSDQEQETEVDTSLSKESPQEETSPSEEKTDAQAEEPKPTPIQAALPEPLSTDADPASDKEVPLRSAQEVAILLQKEDLDEHWESLGWALLAEGDWAGAYWLARSLSAAGHKTPVPPQLLAVLQGSHWLESDTDNLGFDILEIASQWAPPNTTSGRLLGLAAALRPSLLAPQHTGLVGWLPQRDEINPALGTLADAVRLFASAGYPLRPEDLMGVEATETRDKLIEETVKQARFFLETNKSKRLKIKRATDVLHSIVRQSGDLYSLLTPVIENQIAQVDIVLKRMQKFETRRQIEDRIHQIDRDRRTLRARPITGDPINQLVRSVEEALGLAGRWCSQIKQEQGAPHKTNWWTGHVEDLRSRIQSVLPDVISELTRMQADDQPQKIAALGSVLHKTLTQVTCTLGLEEKPASEGSKPWMQRESGPLDQALARRLLWIPEVLLADNGYPEDSEEDIAKFLGMSIAEKRTISTACNMRTENQDFRFTNVLLKALRNEEERKVFEDRVDQALNDARAALGTGLDKVQGVIEQGMVNGLIVEEERTALSSELEMTTIEDALYFKPLSRQLGDIEQKLLKKLEDRLEELNTQWKDIRNELKQHLETDQLKPVDVYIKKAFCQRDTRVVEEGLARFREFLQGESVWSSEWFSPTDERDIFLEFKESVSSLDSALSNIGNVDQLATNVIEQGQTWEGINFGTLPQKRRKEAVLAFRSWHQLKRRNRQHPENGRHIKTLFEYLGFYFPKESQGVREVSQEEKKPAVSVHPSGQDWLHCHVNASAGDLARPIPQLGSQARGYNVVSIWERPGANSIRALLRDLSLDTKPVIIFFLGRLSERRRHDLATQARERGSALVVLDEILLAFLARFDDSRLHGFLRCSLPYASLNPYTPFQAGNVPPEMYYGRDRMVRQLQDEGTGIVFGGRQLGKSALLRQVEREFHQPARHQYAWVEDIKLVGDPNTGELPSSLWIKLREAFKKHQLIKANVTANQPENIIKRIQNSMDESPRRRVLVLFDEADHFLDADARNSFQVVDRLRALIQETRQRFRVVFTGLHDVQRFNNIVNQPLAHFGQNLLVGPLEPGPARQLVREPLETLGYRFVDETTVLKVLSYTNYHPGLIQYFCHELLSLLQGRRFPSGPPYEIRSDDVEAVYRTPQARQVIRERLDWTLALDPRYQCIAWAMICEQKETRGSYARSFSAVELFELAQEWWEIGFQDVDSEGFRGLLGEMVGLGILVRDLDNQYLLRSPNLVRLMGIQEDIENRLVELSYKPQPSKSQPSSHHVPLDNQRRLYSPLTFEQEGNLQHTRQSRVSLIFGSQAMGLDALTKALGRRGSPIPIQELLHADRTCTWLDTHARKQIGIEQVLTYGGLKGTGGDMGQCVWKVLEMCKDFNQRRRRPLHVVFFLNPETAWSWLKLPADRLADLENRTDLLSLRRWDKVGIQQRLSHAYKLDSSEVCQSVLEATGGWPCLLDYLFHQCGSHDDPRPPANILIQEISHPKSKEGIKLIQRSGLGSNPDAHRVFHTLSQYGKVSDSELDNLVDLIEGDPALTSEICTTSVEFLHRLGCIEKIGEEYRTEPVLSRVAGRQ